MAADWQKQESLILYQLEELHKDIKDIQADVKDLRDEIVGVKIKTGIIAGLIGFLAAQIKGLLHIN